MNALDANPLHVQYTAAVRAEDEAWAAVSAAAGHAQAAALESAAQQASAARRRLGAELDAQNTAFAAARAAEIETAARLYPPVQDSPISRITAALDADDDGQAVLEAELNTDPRYV